MTLLDPDQPDSPRVTDSRALYPFAPVVLGDVPDPPDWARPEPFEHDRPTPDPCPPCDSRRQIDAFREWVDTYPPFQTGEGSSA